LLGIQILLDKSHRWLYTYKMKSKETKNPAAVALGRKGGKATASKYSSEQLAKWGKLGGRGNRKAAQKPGSKKGK
jgi:hypothetical protein